jgi:hypothetical protein
VIFFEWRLALWFDLKEGSTSRRAAMGKLPAIQKGIAWKANLPAVLGKTRRIGMIGRIEETSASFEARSAPRLYPTAGGAQ